jgi:hypothetical protein
VVYVIAPLQVRLLQPPDTNTTAQQAWSARIAGTLAALASVACAFLLFQVEFYFVPPSSSAILYSFRAVTSLITLAIYAPLFIAIYLIAKPESPLNIVSTLPDPRPEEDTSPAEEAT